MNRFAQSELNRYGVLNSSDLKLSGGLVVIGNLKKEPNRFVLQMAGKLTHHRRLRLLRTRLGLMSGHRQSAGSFALEAVTKT